MNFLNLVVRFFSICVGIALLVIGIPGSLVAAAAAQDEPSMSPWLIMGCGFGAVLLLGSGFFYVGAFASRSTWTSKHRLISAVLLFFPFALSSYLLLAPGFSALRPVVVPVLAVAAAAALVAGWPAATLKQTTGKE